MNKKYLKNGMVVEDRIGERYLIINNSFVYKDGHICVDEYDENLLYKYGNKNFDIIKIYKTEPYDISDIFNDYFLELLYEREI